MQSSEKSTYVHQVFSKISGSYDLMNDLESLGLHRLWKNRLVRELSRFRPEHILDIACGTGDIAIALAQNNPHAEVIGLDFNRDMLNVARMRSARELPLSFIIEAGYDVRQNAAADEATTEASDKELPASCRTARVFSNNNLKLVEGDALNLPYEDDSFDAVSISFGLRNLPDYEAALVEICRVLRPGGQFRCLESSYPTNALVKPPFKLYFEHWLPILGKLVSQCPEEYSWLSISTKAFLNKEELLTLLRKAGFSTASYTSFLLGAAALHRATK